MPQKGLTTDEVICAFRKAHISLGVCEGEPHKHGIKILQLCEAKYGHVHNTEIYASTHSTDKNHNIACNAVNRLCQQVKNKGHYMYMGQWFSSPKLFDHLETYKTTAEGMGWGKNSLPKTELFGYIMERHHRHSCSAYCQWQ